MGLAWTKEAEREADKVMVSLPGTIGGCVPMITLICCMLLASCSRNSHYDCKNHVNMKGQTYVLASNRQAL